MPEIPHTASIMKKLCFSAVIVMLLLLGGCESLFFHPEKNLRYHPDLCAATPENVLFESYDKTLLHGWYFEPEGQARGVVFFLHGNAQNISLHIHNMLWLREAGYAIFTFDYRGYGISKGEPGIKGVIDDSLAAFDYLLSRELPSDTIIILGQSMGAAIAIDVAAMTSHQDKITAVVADSPFSSWRRIYREKAGQIVLTWLFQYPISWFINDDYAPEKCVQNIPDSISLLFIHDKKDLVVDFKHSERLYEASGKRGELWLSDGAGHVMSMNYLDMRNKIIQYFNRFSTMNRY